MKRLSILFTAFILCAVLAYAGVIQDGSITVSATAQGFTDGLGAVISGDVNGALVAVETGTVRVGFKTAPTATTGIPLYAGDTLTITNAHDVHAFRVILNSGVAAATVRFVLTD